MSLWNVSDAAAAGNAAKMKIANPGFNAFILAFLRAWGGSRGLSSPTVSFGSR